LGGCLFLGGFLFFDSFFKADLVYTGV
jgi:hypothetical protein